MIIRLAPNSAALFRPSKAFTAQGTVTDQGNDISRFLLQVPRFCHADSETDDVEVCPTVKEVMFAFMLGSVACDGIEVLFVDEAVFAACQNCEGRTGWEHPRQSCPLANRKHDEKRSSIRRHLLVSDMVADRLTLFRDQGADSLSQLFHLNEVQCLNVCGTVHFVYDCCLCVCKSKSLLLLCVQFSRMFLLVVFYFLVQYFQCFSSSL